MGQPVLPPVLDALLKKFPASAEKMHLLFLCALLDEVDKAKNSDKLLVAAQDLQNFLRHTEV